MDLYNYSHGMCEVFALALHKLTGWEFGLLWDEDEMSAEVEPLECFLHIFCFLPDGSMVDSMGVRSFEDMVKDYAPVKPRIKKITLGEVRRCVNKPDGAWVTNQINKIQDFLTRNKRFKKIMA